MSSNRLPFSVRATDVVHRSFVLGLVGVSLLGLASITANIWKNSDYSSYNKNKSTFVTEGEVATEGVEGSTS